MLIKLQKSPLLLNFFVKSLATYIIAKSLDKIISQEKN